MASTDTSAKFHKFSVSGNASQLVNSYNEPWRQYSAKGQGASMHSCSTSGTFRYRSFFRPDSEFNYQFGSSNATKCNP